MGKRGPAKTPTNLRVLRGEKPTAQEPKPDAGEVKAPPRMSPAARVVWRQLAPDLEKKAVLTPWDVREFATYCDAEARNRTAAEHLDREGEVIEMPVFNKNGEVTGHRVGKNPWMLIYESTAALKSRVGARFGLTPSDRADLSIGEESKDDRERLLS